MGPPPAAVPSCALRTVRERPPGRPPCESCTHADATRGEAGTDAAAAVRGGHEWEKSCAIRSPAQPTTTPRRDRRPGPLMAPLPSRGGPLSVEGVMRLVL